MTLEAIVRLLALHLAYLVVGASVVWAVGGGTSWGRLLRLGGAGYLGAVALLGVVWSQLLVAGVPVRPLTIVLTLVVVVVLALVAGRRLGRTAPRPSSIPAGWSAVVSAAGVGLVAVFFAALFRAGRLQGLQAYDAWAFWIPKAKGIHETGRLDLELLRLLSWPSYPQLVPVHDAVAFFALGSDDVVTLHLQFWCFALGFVWAVGGILAPHVPSWILWPFVVLVLVVPRMGGRLLTPQADYLLDFFFVVAALALGLWLVSRDDRLLVLAAALLSACVLTKREGLLLAACAAAATVIASTDRWRTAWPRLAAVGAVVILSALPWRLWYAHHGIAGESPGGGLLGTDGRDGRLGPSIRLALDVLFDPGRWSIVPFVVLVAVLLGALARGWRLSVFAGSLVGALLLGGIWATWAFTDIPITEDEAVSPIVRYTAAIVLVAATLVPLLLGQAWRAVSEGRRG